MAYPDPEEVQEVTSQDESSFPLFRVSHSHVKPLTADLSINGVNVTMEIDTGAAMSVMSCTQQLALFPASKITPSSIVLRTYTTEKLHVIGEMTVTVKYQNQQATMPLFVVDGEGPALLGRNWFAHIRLDWANIAYSSHTPELQAVLDSHADVFKDELGTVKGTSISLAMKDSTVPKFFRPRPVPLALKDTISKELDRLEKAGINSG